MRKVFATVAVYLSFLLPSTKAQEETKVSVVKNVAEGAFAYPSYSHKHSCYIAQQKKGAFLQLYSINSDQSVRQLTFDSADHSHPRVSVSGDWVAYTKEVNGMRDIWLLNLATTEQINLTNTANYSEAHPAWAMNDSLIVFNTNRFDSLQEISAIRLHDGKIKRLTTNLEEDTYGSLSPDGKKLIYTKWLNEEKNPEIYLLHLDDTTETRLTDNAVRDIAPVWLSDSVISYTQNGSILIHHLSRNDQRRLTTADSSLLFVRGVPFGKSALLCERIKDNKLDGIAVLQF
jgi:Tol biopolymer transport system component